MQPYYRPLWRSWVPAGMAIVEIFVFSPQCRADERGRESAKRTKTCNKSSVGIGRVGSLLVLLFGVIGASSLSKRLAALCALPPLFFPPAVPISDHFPRVVVPPFLRTYTWVRTPVSHKPPGLEPPSQRIPSSVSLSLSLSAQGQTDAANPTDPAAARPSCAAHSALLPFVAHKRCRLLLRQ